MAENLKDKRILVIVESPNKIKHFQEFLHNAGYKKAVVMASVGHICQIKTGGKTFNTGVDANDNFKLSYVVSDDKKDVVKKLKEQADVADKVILFSDPDREGSSISWSLIKFLKLKKDKYIRCVTHEITPKAVVTAIENPIQLETDLIEAAEARRIEDIYIGYGLSPRAKRVVGAKSIGRCQTAALMMVVDREQEIINFKPEAYIDLYLNFEKNGTKFKAKYVGTDTNKVDHLKTTSEVNLVKLACSGDFIIKNIEKREKQESPKPPFCTATFQQEATSKLGLSTKSAMDIAQNLFHSGYITYMRTDDQEVSPEFVPELRKYVEGYLGAKFVVPRTGKKQTNAQEGHECLRITDPNLTPEEFAKLGNNDFAIKVYRLIWQRTIAACLPNTIISETTYDIYNNDQKFNFVSNEIVSEGYRQVYNYKDEDRTESDVVKETFNNNEVLQNTKLEDIAKKTSPKPRFTEATLLKMLDTTGVGRPSTFQTIVDTVLSESRGYCTLEGKSIVPTDRGIQLINYVKRAFPDIINIKYTSQMEEKLDLIANGKATKLEVLTEFYNNLKTALDNDTTVNPAEKVEKICPKCGAPMVVRRSKFGRLFYGCSKWPNCNGIINI